MTDLIRSAFCTPNRRLMLDLTASDHFWEILDALGFSDDSLLPDSPAPALDLRPRRFAVRSGEPVGSFRVHRVGWSHFHAMRRPRLGQELSSNEYLETRTIAAESEQQAGELLLEFCPIRTGIHRQALERWLKLWGWTPPPPAV